MQQFLAGSNNTVKIKSLFKEDGDIYLAVAFWGFEAKYLIDERIKKFPRRKIRIVCNLQSGATNPDFVQFCLELPQVEIKTSACLHGKVIFIGGKYLVGSSNISSNGLGHEGDEAKGWMECSVFGDDRILMSDIEKWFSDEWQSSLPITEKMIEDSRRLYGRRRRSRPLISEQKYKNLLTALLREPEAFKDKNIYVAIYRDGLSNEGQKAHKDYEIEVGTTKLSSYENWDGIPEDSYLVDIYCGARGKVCVDGFVYIPKYPHRSEVQYEHDEEVGEILFGHRIDEIEGYGEFCSVDDLKIFIPKLYERYVENKGDGVLIEISKIKFEI